MLPDGRILTGLYDYSAIIRDAFKRGSYYDLLDAKDGYDVSDSSVLEIVEEFKSCGIPYDRHGIIVSG